MLASGGSKKYETHLFSLTYPSVIFLLLVDGPIDMTPFPLMLPFMSFLFCLTQFSMDGQFGSGTTICHMLSHLVQSKSRARTALSNILDVYSKFNPLGHPNNLFCAIWRPQATEMRLLLTIFYSISFLAM
jgi:hypothetical protein